MGHTVKRNKLNNGVRYLVLTMQSTLYTTYIRRSCCFIYGACLDV